MGFTSRYGLKKINVGDNISDDSYKFSDADRDTEDLLLFLGVEGHHHSGGVGTSNTPTLGASLTVVSTSGVLPSGRRVFYRYTMISPTGTESGASPEAFVDTPAQIQTPAKPNLSFATTGGTLLPGNYYYVLSAYSGAVSNFETPAVNPEYLLVDSATSTNAITITLPALPSGATAFNVYRQAPDGPGYFFVASVDMSMATPPTTFVDTGLAPNCDRTRPLTNTTRQTNSVILSLPTALPAGWSWRIYRTFTVNDYTNSLLTTQSVSPYTDVGTPTTFGQPPLQGVTVGSPAKVQLTDMAEAQGRLPLSGVSAFPEIVTFTMDGNVFALTGTNVWVCEHPQATIVAVRASLGRGYMPSNQAVIVNVKKGSGATPTFASIFTADADRPRIPVGLQIGARMPPTAIMELVEGDCLTVDVDQGDTAEPPTAQDLTVSICLYSYGWADPLSHPWTVWP
jgi:hypothetical protein